VLLKYLGLVGDGRSLAGEPLLIYCRCAEEDTTRHRTTITASISDADATRAVARLILGLFCVRHFCLATMAFSFIAR